MKALTKKYISFALILALSLIQCLPFSLNAATSEQAVTQLEKKVFGITYLREPVEKRLARLEENVFGQASTNGSADQRIQKLNKVFEVQTTQAPESFKKELEQIAQQEKNSQTQQQVSQKPEEAETKVQILPNQTELAQKMLRIINQERSFRSLRALNEDQISTKVALEQASYMAQTRQFSHFGVKGKNPDQRYTEAGGMGKVEELVDGFFATADEKGQIIPVEVNAETPNQLMDAILKVPDKADIVFNIEANAAGISFVVSPDKRQLAVVIEILSDFTSIAGLPVKSQPAVINVSGSVGQGYKFAWIGVAQKELDLTEKVEVEASPYFPPIDKVIYADKTGDRAKSIAKTGGMILAMVAAPFTYGASMLVADILMQSIAQTYQAQDVEVRSGMRASDSSFNGNIGIGEWGPGLYYVSVWAFPARAKKPVIVSRRTVLVT
jgi:uncharacterized protein YkwD